MMIRYHALLGAAIILAAAGSVASSQAADTLTGVPHGANIVVSLNLKDVREQPDFENNFQKLLYDTGGDLSAKLNEIKEKTGLNPVRDLDSFAMGAYLHGTKKSLAEAHWVVALHGRFDAARLVKGIESIEGVREKTLSKREYKGVTVYADKDPVKEGCWAVVGQCILIGNDSSRLEKAIEAVQANQSATGDPKLAPYLSQARKNCVFWGVGYAPNRPKTATPPPPQPGAARVGALVNASSPEDLVKHFVLSFDNQYGADLESKFTCKDAPSAGQLKNQLELLRGVLSIALLQAKPGPAQQSAAKLNQVLQKLSFAVAADTVTLSLKLTKSETNEFMLELDALGKANMSEKKGN